MKLQLARDFSISYLLTDFKIHNRESVNIGSNASDEYFLSQPQFAESCSKIQKSS